MLCRLIGSCLFVCFIAQCTGQSDLVDRCETCREVVKNFHKACSLMEFTHILYSDSYLTKSNY